MKALSIKNIFKTIEAGNYLADVSGMTSKKYLQIYLNDVEIYRGNDYKAYCKMCKQDYIPKFAEYLTQFIFCTNKGKFWDDFGHENEIEFYIYTK